MNITAHPLSVDAEVAYRADLLSHADGSHRPPQQSSQPHVLRRLARGLRTLARDFAQELAQDSCPIISAQEGPQRA